MKILLKLYAYLKPDLPGSELISYPPVYNLPYRLHPLPGRLGLHLPLQEVLKGHLQALLALEVVEMLVHPMTDHVQHSKGEITTICISIFRSTLKTSIFDVRMAIQDLKFHRKMLHHPKTQ